jgi:hypothetical protein
MKIRYQRLCDELDFFPGRAVFFSARSGNRPVVLSGSCFFPARLMLLEPLSIGVRPGLRESFSMFRASFGAMSKIPFRVPRWLRSLLHFQYGDCAPHVTSGNGCNESGKSR